MDPIFPSATHSHQPAAPLLHSDRSRFAIYLDFQPSITESPMQTSLLRQRYRYRCQPVRGTCPGAVWPLSGTSVSTEGPDHPGRLTGRACHPPTSAPPTLRRASLLTFILVALSYWLPCRAYTTNGSVTPSSETTWSLWDLVPDVCSQGRGVRAARLPRSARLRSCSRRSPGRGDVPGLSHYDSKKATTLCCHKCNNLTALALRLWGSEPCQDAIPFDPMKLQPVGFNRVHGPAAT
jgi:hypothetical protein